jgi:hypothetical protein
VEFDDHKKSIVAKNILDNKQVLYEKNVITQLLDIKLDSNRNRIYIGDLENRFVTPKQLKDTLYKYGPIQNMDLGEKFAFVSFVEEAHAANALHNQDTIVSSILISWRLQASFKSANIIVVANRPGYLGLDWAGINTLGSSALVLDKI